MQRQVEDVMTREVISVGAETPVGQIATGGVLVGVISRGDMLRPYARRDAAIRREVEAVLRRRLWIRPEEVGVRVDKGTAMLTGAVGRRSTADIATRLATAVAGVTKVVNRIRYDFDDTELVRSKVGRTHPFSAEPFHPDKLHRRGRIRRITSRSLSLPGFMRSQDGT